MALLAGAAKVWGATCAASGLRACDGCVVREGKLLARYSMKLHHVGLASVPPAACARDSLGAGTLNNTRQLAASTSAMVIGQLLFSPASWLLHHQTWTLPWV